MVRAGPATAAIILRDAARLQEASREEALPGEVVGLLPANTIELLRRLGVDDAPARRDERQLDEPHAFLRRLFGKPCAQCVRRVTEMTDCRPVPPRRWC